MNEEVRYRPFCDDFGEADASFAEPAGYGGPEPFFSRGAGFQTNGAAPKRSPIYAKPYVYRDPTSLPPRRWIYGRHYVRGYVSTTVAPSGIGKTGLVIAEAVSMVSGIALLAGAAPKPLRVWIWNGEDPLDELERRVAAVLIHYGLNGGHLADRLFLNSGRSTPLIIATRPRDSVIVAEPVVDEIIREIRDKLIDVVVIDPFVSSHSVPENDNGAVDRVAKTWAMIADVTGCSVELVHHVRKPANGAASEYTIDDARGAGALIAATRAARVLNVMSKEDAEKAEIEPEQRRAHFRVDDGKSSMQPPIEKAVWHKLVSVALGNGDDEDGEDHVGVVTSWVMPGAFDGLSTNDLRAVQKKISEGQWAENIQSSNWAGRAVAEALELDASTAGGKQRVKTMLQTWIANKALRVEYQHSARDGREKPMIVVGAWA